jgi:hypothetical protein
LTIVEEVILVKLFNRSSVILSVGEEDGGLGSIMYSKKVKQYQKTYE